LVYKIWELGNYEIIAQILPYLGYSMILGYTIAIYRPNLSLGVILQYLQWICSLVSCFTGFTFQVPFEQLRPEFRRSFQAKFRSNISCALPSSLSTGTDARTALWGWVEYISKVKLHKASVKQEVQTQLLRREPSKAIVGKWLPTTFGF
jgi:hypothetical protein